jgi:hypothetical protein
MSHRRRSVLEKQIQRDIEADLGAEPDLLLLRNSVGKATYVDDDAHEYHVPYGLGVGSPDLVGLLRLSIGKTTVAIWFCLELKTPEGKLDPEQEKCHAIWRRFGAFVETVRSVADARCALERARHLLNGRAAA